MDNLLRYDNKFFEALGKVTDIVILNLFCIISCLPIITIGTSITTTYSVSMKMVKNEDTYIVREFIKRFRENFKSSTVVWAIMLVIGGILAFDIYMCKLISNELIGKILQFVFTMISIIYIFSLTYVFPLISKFENTIKNTMINSILISIQNLPYTIIVVIINLSPLLLINLLSNHWTYIVFFYIVIGFGMIAYINSIFFEKIFKRLIN